MILALITGTLWKSPEAKASRAGKNFVSGTLRIKDGESVQFIRFVAFSETAQAELMRLGEGDAVSIQGAFKAELYTPEGGEPRVSLSIVADKILALCQPPKERTKFRATTPEPTDEVGYAKDTPYRGGPAPFNDPIPFGCAP
jgi:single-stranded DNA-binding protein